MNLISFASLASSEPVNTDHTTANMKKVKSITLSNTQLPNDTDGNLLLTGEMSLLNDNGTFFLYSNVWGGCPGIDCCNVAGFSGCATCCFTKPPLIDPCVYTNNHTVVAYKTTDFVSFISLGAVLPPSARLPGIEFRPQVIQCPSTGLYVMWYEDRWSSGTNRGYAVAHSSSASGPFVTVTDSVILPGNGRVGDYDLFIDEVTGVAYHVRTGLTIVELASNCSAPALKEPTEIPNGNVEGPAMFKRLDIYYLLVGQGCCACKGGSNVIVYTANTPLGPWFEQGDVGSNKTDNHTYDPRSPFNFVTRAQQTKVIKIPSDSNPDQWLWVGNAWVTSTLPGNPRNSDLLYFTLLNFEADGNITQIVRKDECVITL